MSMLQQTAAEGGVADAAQNAAASDALAAAANMSALTAAAGMGASAAQGGQQPSGAEVQAAMAQVLQWANIQEPAAATGGD
jgi:hypothetical protein